MDNNGILYEKDNKGLNVHRISPDFHNLNLRYGLTILAGNRKQITAPMSESKIKSLRYFEFYSISHLLGNEGVYIDSEKREYKIRQGQVIIVTPGTMHNYGGINGEFVESFLLFTGPVADQLRDAGIISNVICDMGKVPRLNKVIDLALDPSIASQIQANITLQQILMDLYHTNKRIKSNKQYPCLIQLLDEIMHTSDRWWTVSEMAEYCNVSDAHFRHIFRQYTGQSPKQYIDERKIRQAAELLCSSVMSVHKIAERFAYRDPYHFSRRFKQITGFSPEHYRASFSLHSR
jgi:AraC-like DNA-binding protein